MTSNGLIIVRAMVIIVPFITTVALGMISFLAIVLDSVTCFLGMNDILKVLSTLTLAALI
jgi:hypothetical protein